MEILTEKAQTKVKKEYPLIHFDMIALVWIIFLYFIITYNVQSSTITIMAILSVLYLLIVFNPNSKFSNKLNDFIFRINLRTLPWATKNSKIIKWGCLVVLVCMIMMLGIFLSIESATILSLIYIISPFLIVMAFSKRKSKDSYE
ncbi:hypothetical protein [Candidatus Lokiarchaeum ossiferum]|uniref:hypothetical protein n=1 Tax=Candidatus Lokiarchaeum ossiferum TaxID=2951803 RepID=UPI00352C6909